MKTALVVILCAFIAITHTKVYYEESFGDGWEERWAKSSASGGEMKLARGEYYGDEEKDYGLQTTEDAKFYHWSSKMEEPVATTEGKDIIIQFTLKNEQDLKCGGAYIKILKSGLDQDKFDGESDYNIMFGPDVCGSKKLVHIIFNYKGDNHLWKKTTVPKMDKLTHLYTLVVMPDNKYQFKIDNLIIESGNLADDWDMLPPMEIPDKEAVKPEDWEDEEFVPDPDSVKPDDWEDEPEVIVDPEAEKPEDWDDEFDGDWEAPMIPNPEYKGEWKPKMIKNEEYKGPWSPPMIPNPDYYEDDSLYVQKDMEYVGIDLWQVESGSIFDNILVTDDAQYAKDFAEKVFAPNFEKEKTMFDAAEEVRKADAEQAAAAAAAATDEEISDSESESDAETRDEL